MMASENQLAEERTEMAEERTDWALERTLLANMRTYSSWIRSGLAAMGVGLAVQAIFSEVDPTWIARSLASFFTFAGIAVIYFAYLKAVKCQREMDTHQSFPMTIHQLRLFTGLLIAGGTLLVFVLWTL